MYRQDVTGLLGNVAAATQARRSAPEAGGQLVPYLRTASPLGPESLAAYPSRLRVNRSNPYLQPGGLNSLAGGLASFETRHCTGGIAATFPSKAAAIADPAFADWARYDVDSDELGDFYDLLRQFTLNDHASSNNVAAPPCTKQGPYGSIGGTSGEATDYLHVRELP